ncbi:MAG: transcriptional regulator, partial [Aquabacterium sp.]
MDKRYETLTLPQQLELRKKAINDVLANPQWS